MLYVRLYYGLFDFEFFLSSLFFLRKILSQPRTYSFSYDIEGNDLFSLVAISRLIVISQLVLHNSLGVVWLLRWRFVVPISILCKREKEIVQSPSIYRNFYTISIYMVCTVSQIVLRSPLFLLYNSPLPYFFVLSSLHIKSFIRVFKRTFKYSGDFTPWEFVKLSNIKFED